MTSESKKSVLTIAGLGSGKSSQITAEVLEALKICDCVAGYETYINLLKQNFSDDWISKKEFLSTPMRKEEERCRLALEKADSGKNVLFVCSGDAGVYGLSGLIYEMSADFPNVEISVLPGITAALSGAALLGAPLIHDFAVISLSDRLTGWETISRRLDLAAKADLSIVLYNPASKGRPDHLRKACDILLRTLPPERPCGIARAIGREGEAGQVLTLGELRGTDVDMFCTVFIGNSMTKVVSGKLLTPRGYRYA